MANIKTETLESINAAMVPPFIRRYIESDTFQLIQQFAAALEADPSHIQITIQAVADPVRAPEGAPGYGATISCGLKVRVVADPSAPLPLRDRIRHAGSALEFMI